jgi:hypothetical protein
MYAYVCFLFRRGFFFLVGLYCWTPVGISVDDCVTVPGLSHALAFAFRSDNAGPPAAPEVISVFQQVCIYFCVCYAFCLCRGFCPAE